MKHKKSVSLNELFVALLLTMPSMLFWSHQQTSMTVTAFTTLPRRDFGKHRLLVIHPKPDFFNIPTGASSSSSITLDTKARNIIPAPTSSLLSLSSSSLSSEEQQNQQQHAREIFSMIDSNHNGTLSSDELGEVLSLLDIPASTDDISALFNYLDANGDGEIDFDDEFAPWYEQVVSNARDDSDFVRGAILGRRTVYNFDETRVSKAVLRRAIECALCAPNHGRTEPWRFIDLGRETVRDVAELKVKMMKDRDQEGVEEVRKMWEGVPGWCVVTCVRSPDDAILEEEDFVAASCAIQNFMLSMYSEGVGTRWTLGDVVRSNEFADLCGVDLTKEKIVGCIWYGFAKGGLGSLEPPKKRKSVEDVLSSLP